MSAEERNAEEERKWEELLHDFKNEPVVEEWSTYAEDCIWSTYRDWDHEVLVALTDKPRFEILSLECRSTSCFLVVTYPEGVSVGQDAWNDPDEMVSHLEINCGGTVRYDEEKNTKEILLLNCVD